MSLIQKVAIFGAAGAIGRSLAPELERRGIPFRAVGRDKAKLEAAFGKMAQAELLDADLTDLRSAGAAARGVDTIIYCVGVPYTSFELHPKMMRVTIEAAATMQVPRVVLVSPVYSYGVPRTSRVSETHPREPQARKGKFRKEQQDALFEAHRQGRLQGMVIVVPDFYGPHADLSLANPIFRAAIDGKTANWLGPVNAPHEFIFVPDAGPAIIDLAECAGCYGEMWNLAGTADINVMDFITRVYRAAGRSPKYRSVGRGMLKIMGWFNPLYREFIEMMYLEETPVLLDDAKLRARFPALRKTSYDDGIRQTIEWMRK
jgi:nucleoside-diphosphate-sugar epimerase